MLKNLDVSTISESVNVKIKIGKNDTTHEVHVECLCPHCESANIKLNGHDTGVNGNPQKCYCRDCKRYFYPHTSYHAKNIHSNLKENIGKCLENGRFNANTLKAAVPASLTTIYNLLTLIITLINQTIAAKKFWAEKVEATALFIDETFLTIGRKTWYLIVIINEAGRVLGFDIIRHRTAMNIIAMLFPIMMRLKKAFTFLVTDGYSAYKKVAKMLGMDIVHVQHIHKPPYGRVIITKITHMAEKIVMKTFASMNDIFKDTNGFIGQVSVDEEKKVNEKRGRPKGSRNKKKKVAVEESREKEDVNDGKYCDLPDAKNNDDNIPAMATDEDVLVILKEKKRAREFKKGTTNMYQYNAKEGTVVSLYGSDEEIRDVLASLLLLFMGKCITTNLIESLFSACKALVSFRGRRTLEGWLAILGAYFVTKSCPEVLEEALNQLHLTAYLGNKMLSTSTVAIECNLEKAVA
jgi:transposase-like protein